MLVVIFWITGRQICALTWITNDTDTWSTHHEAYPVVGSEAGQVNHYLSHVHVVNDGRHIPSHVSIVQFVLGERHLQSQTVDKHVFKCPHTNVSLVCDDMWNVKTPKSHCDESESERGDEAACSSSSLHCWKHKSLCTVTTFLQLFFNGGKRPDLVRLTQDSPDSGSCLKKHWYNKISPTFILISALKAV